MYGRLRIAAWLGLVCCWPLISACATPAVKPTESQGAAVDASTLQGKPKYAVVISKSNSYKGTGAAAKAMVRKLYLRSLSRWTGNGKAKAFGRAPNSAIQKKFCESVLKMDDASLARHWLRQKNERGLAPPKEVRSSRMLSRLLVRYKDAFGLLTIQEAAKDPGVRVLFTF